MNTQFDYGAVVKELDSLADQEVSVPKRVRDRMVEYFGSKCVDLMGANVLDYQEPHTGVRLSLFWGSPEGRVDVKKASLVEWLTEASREPCYCGSGKYYEKCHAKEELPTIVASLVSRSSDTAEMQARQAKIPDVTIKTFIDKPERELFPGQRAAFEHLQRVYAKGEKDLIVEDWYRQQVREAEKAH